MTSEFLLDAIGQMDDELVMEAAQPTRRTIPWAKVSGWAAALLLCVGIASLPGLLSMNGAGSEAAAPEMDLFVGDVMTQDGSADYEYRSDQESQVQVPSAADKANTKTESASATQGVFEPRFFTQRGVYLLIGEELPYEPQLPVMPNAKALGELVASVPGEQAYPSTGTRELVGCPVWESEDGEYLYIQLPDGGCLIASLYE